MNYHLGLDIGIASVGAALITDSRIVELFVRTFEKAETSKEGNSLNKIRREARLTRRRTRRRAFRLTRSRRLFSRHKLIDTPDISSIILPGQSPWELRAKALDQCLTSRELACLLYHLIKHRGFQSNRKSELSDKQMGAMLTGIQNNQTLMHNKGYRTVGEMIYKAPEFSHAKHNKRGSYHHTLSRGDIVAEAKTVFNAQRQLNNAFATTTLEAQVIKLLLARRPALSGDDLLKKVGECRFEKSEYRAPKACFSVEKFIWLSKLNNLRILNLGESRPLDHRERQRLMLEPFKKTKLTYKQIKKLLDLPEHASFNTLTETTTGKDPESQTFFEAKYYHKLKKAYKKAKLNLEWSRDAFDTEKLDKLAWALTVYKTDQDIQEYLQKNNIEEKVITAILTESFSGFIHLSLKALYKIIPLMEQGMRYDEAASECYGHHSVFNNPDHKSKTIPPLSENTITNPVVKRSVNQARKLINAIVKKYGAPASVHIELARDLNKSLKERQQIEKRQKEQAEVKKQDIDYFKEIFNYEPNGLDLLKLRLYREQSGQCAYTQKPIDLHRLSEPHYVEVDHVIPYSRSFDNSYNNKVVVLKQANQNKGNRTPYEYIGRDKGQWQKFEAWVRSTYKNNRKKAHNLLLRKLEKQTDKEFLPRNLQDTRYAGKVLKNLIETHLLLDKQSSSKRCVVVSGSLTSFLRGKWGLNKVRSQGDKHHALDAAVVAACTHAMVKRLARYSKAREVEWAKQDFIDPETGEIINIDAIRALEFQFPQPWPYFREELIARLSDNPRERLKKIPDLGYSQQQLDQVKPIRVSRMPTRRGLGAAHEDTIRSCRYMDKQVSFTRTDISKIKLKDLPKIVGGSDPRNHLMLQAISSRLKQFSDKPDKAFAEPIYKPCKANGFNPDVAFIKGFEKQPAPRIRTLKLTTTQKSGLPVRNGIANNGDMIRIDLFTNGKHFFVVPLYVADTVKKSLPNKAFASGKPESEWIEMDHNYQFLYSFYPNDWIEVDMGKKGIKQGYYGGFDRSTGAIGVWAHDRNQAVGKNGLVRVGIKTVQAIKKYHIDILGNAYLAPKEKRQKLSGG